MVQLHRTGSLDNAVWNIHLRVYSNERGQRVREMSFPTRSTPVGRALLVCAQANTCTRRTVPTWQALLGATRTRTCWLAGSTCAIICRVRGVIWDVALYFRPVDRAKLHVIVAPCGTHVSTSCL